MKSIITILILFLVISTLSAQSYKAAFRTDMCNCLEEESLKRQLTENAFKTCLRETLPKYATQIDAEIKEEDINKKYYLGQIARKDLLVAMRSELIYSCKVYYKHLDFKRTSKKLIARENAKESDLEKYNQMVALTPTAMAYFLRAQLYFNLGKIKKTEEDINKSLSLNPNKANVKSTRHELLLLASVYEEQERYKEAIALYDKVYFGDSDTKVAQLRALADKKAGGTINNIPQISNNEAIKDKADTTDNIRGRKPNNSRSRGQTKDKRGAKTKNVKKKDSASLRKLLKIGNR